MLPTQDTETGSRRTREKSRPNAGDRVPSSVSCGEKHRARATREQEVQSSYFYASTSHPQVWIIVSVCYKQVIKISPEQRNMTALQQRMSPSYAGRHHVIICCCTYLSPERFKHTERKTFLSTKPFLSFCSPKINLKLT